MIRNFRLPANQLIQQGDRLAIPRERDKKPRLALTQGCFGHAPVSHRRSRARSLDKIESLLQQMPGSELFGAGPGSSGGEGGGTLALISSPAAPAEEARQQQQASKRYSPVHRPPPVSTTWCQRSISRPLRTCRIPDGQETSTLSIRTGPLPSPTLTRGSQAAA